MPFGNTCGDSAAQIKTPPIKAREKKSRFISLKIRPKRKQLTLGRQGPLYIFYSDFMPLRLDGTGKMMFPGLKTDSVLELKLTREPVEK